MENPLIYFSQMPDPRIDRCKAHSLEDIIFITIAAVICGAETWNDIEIYGKSKEVWLREHLELSNGIPSHDTFNRFFSSLSPDVFEAAFLSWVRALSSLTDGEVVSIDGKTVRGSRDSGGKHAIHMVSAWANVNRLSLGQVKVDDKSNEITAIPKLLDVLALKGCLVTIDAIGCQRKIAEKIISKEADYILAVKGNQGILEENIRDTVRFTEISSHWKEDDFGHGRIIVFYTKTCLLLIMHHVGNHFLVWSKSNPHVISNQEKQTRFYITSSDASAEIIGRAVRAHWGIENQLQMFLFLPKTGWACGAKFFSY